MVAVVLVVPVAAEASVAAVAVRSPVPVDGVVERVEERLGLAGQHRHEQDGEQQARRSHRGRFGSN